MDLASRPPLRSEADAARDAAETAEFNARRWVWVPDAQEGYLAGFVVDDQAAATAEEEDEGKASVNVHLSNGAGIRRVLTLDLSPMNPPKFDRVDDIADLTFLNEASVVHNLRLRFGAGSIYTYSGLFLISLNPYQHLPVYTPAVVASYRLRRKEECAPHIFATAERAWTQLVGADGTGSCQSILITGESGAGKTENTKKVIQYLAAVASSSSASSASSNCGSGGDVRPSASRSGSSSSLVVAPSHGLPRSGSRVGTALDRVAAEQGILEQQILQANPILEAFGNAQTLRNNNSSRFGKFVRLLFSHQGYIVGANIDWYLLEKSRVTSRSEGERSFHVFYQLLRSGSRARQMRQKLRLPEDPDPTQFAYLKSSRTEVEGVDDEAEWKVLQQAMRTVGFTEDDAFDAFRVVAAILHLGNVPISQDYGGQAQVSDLAAVENACHLLGLDVAEFMRATLRPTVRAGRETVTQARTKVQAEAELGALCKMMHEKAFAGLVDRVNRALDKPGAGSRYIGVLDIAGFEIFDVNGYEQLLINFTNERLQQFFNHHMFVLEQDEYSREQIDWSFVNFGLDLQPTIDLIESQQPIGLLPTLDEECIMPKATDVTFLEKVTHTWSSGDRFKPTRFGKGFVVKHYAGDVEYDVDGWLQKNKDPINENVATLLSRSTVPALAKAFEEYAESSQIIKRNGGGGGMKRGAFRTVSQRHRQQLNSLITQLQSTEPHFVRCIVPNAHKRPGMVDVPLVLDQLRCNGVLEGIRIARLGYPNRLLFAEFRQRYEVMLQEAGPKGFIDSRKASIQIIQSLDVPADSYKIGLTKIFFKAGALAELEEKRDAHLYELFARFQSLARRFSARRRLNKLLNRSSAAKTIQQNARAYNELRDWPWWQLFVQIRPLLKATKDQEEAKRRAVDIELAQERAKADAAERERVAALQATLEAEREALAKELQAEKDLAAERVRLLEHAKSSEASAREKADAFEKNELTLLIEVETLKEKLAHLETEANDAITRLEAQRSEFENALQERELPWQRKAAEWSEKVVSANQARQTMETKMADAVNREKDLRDEIKRLTEDANSRRQRSERHLAEALQNLDAEKKKAEKLARDAASAQKEALTKSKQIQQLVAETDGHDSQLKHYRSQISEIQAKYDALARDHRQIKQSHDEMQAMTADFKRRLDQVERDRAQAAKALTLSQKELDGMRALMASKSSAEAQNAESRRSLEKEVAATREQLAQSQSATKTAEEQRRKALSEADGLRLALEKASSREQNLMKDVDRLAAQARESKDAHASARSAIESATKRRDELEHELADVREQLLKSDDARGRAIKEAEHATRQLASHKKKLDDYDEAIVKISSKMESQAAQLVAESRKREAQDSQLAEAKEAYQVAVAARDGLQGEMNTLLEEVVALRKHKADTIVDHKHYHVLDKAKKVTDKQLAEAQQMLTNVQEELHSTQRHRSKLQQEIEDERRLRMDMQKEHAKVDQAAVAAPLKKALEEEQRAKSIALNKVKDLERVVKELQQKSVESRRSSRLLQELQINNSELQRQMDHALNDENGRSANKRNVPRDEELASELADLRQKMVKSDELKVQAGRQIESMRSQLTQTHTKYGDAQRHIESLQSKLDKQALQLQDVSKLEAFMKQIRSEADGYRREIADLKPRYEAQAAAAQSSYDANVRELEAKISTMRDRYQGELEAMSEDLARQRAEAIRYKEANKQLKKKEEELRELLDSELHSGEGWRNEKHRLEERVAQIGAALEGEKSMRQKAEDRHASHLSLIKELRDKQIDLESELAAVKEAKRRLQERTDGLLGGADGEFNPNRLTQDRLVSALTAEKQELLTNLREAEVRWKRLQDKQTRMEAYVSENKAELAQLRQLNADLDRRNSHLENENKSLQVKLIDFETQGYTTSSPRIAGARRRPA